MDERMLDWPAYLQHIEVLREKLRGSLIQVVYGLPPHGLIPAVIISHAIGANLVETSSLAMLLHVHNAAKRPNILVVDAFTKDGSQFLQFSREERVTTASVYHAKHPGIHCDPTVYGMEQSTGIDLRLPYQSETIVR